MEDPRFRRVTAVGGILAREFGAGAVGGGEEDSCASGDLVGESELASVCSWHVAESEYVISVSHHWRAPLPVTRGEVARDRVGAARWSGEYGEVCAAANAVVKIGEKCVVE